MKKTEITKKIETAKKRRYEGIVVSKKNTNTVIVSVKMKKRHTFYNKVISKTRRFMAHTKFDSKVHSSVVIEQTKPISKNKKWKVVKVLDNNS